jgi:predicted CxxxxCH...CXXCH cytochrome family protein
VDGTYDECGTTCHTLPPGGTHTTNTACELCHGVVISSFNSGDPINSTWADPSRHIDGVVDVVGLTCTTCHGSGSDPAPPVDTGGQSATTDIGVGAHQSHQGPSTWHRDIQCSDCHVVPVDPSDPTHRDGGSAELTWGAVSAADGASPAFDQGTTTCSGVYCHGETLLTGGSNTTPDWTSVGTGEGDCGTCHGLPPGGGHSADPVCENCHDPSISFFDSGTPSNSTWADRTRHIDGIVDFGAAPCSSCHIMGGAHTRHATEYNFGCSTCHFGHGFGTPTHQDATADVTFDPNGLATRNGADSNTPTWNAGAKTCDNVYCHSSGNTADRGSDATYTWGILPFAAMSYATAPNWDTGTISDCDPCHAGNGNMTAPYDIYRPGLITGSGDFPNSGAHRRSAHNSNSQDFDGLPSAATEWTEVQCFWCHNTDGADPINGPNFQGTYGTSWHVDGQTYFEPRNWPNGTIAPGMSYSANGAAAHCGNSRSCW